MASGAVCIDGRPAYIFDIDLDELNVAVDTQVMNPPPTSRPGFFS